MCFTAAADSGCGCAGEDWVTVYKIVVPTGCRKQLLELAHEHVSTIHDHLGVTKAYDHILKHFFWPGLKADMLRFCKTCHTCQVVGKQNQVVPPAPLRSIPVLGSLLNMSSLTLWARCRKQILSSS